MANSLLTEKWSELFCCRLDFCILLSKVEFKKIVGVLTRVLDIILSRPTHSLTNFFITTGTIFTFKYKKYLFIPL